MVGIGSGTFMLRSSCTAERFTTITCVHKLSAFLQKMPSLVHLISSKPIDASTLKAISRGRLFPKLQTIVCGGFSDFDDMVDMLEHRSWYFQTCRSAKSGKYRTLGSITYSQTGSFFLSGSCQDRIKKFEADGLHID
jgi:hypothetical protein